MVGHSDSDIKEIARTVIAEYRAQDEERFALQMQSHDRDNEAHENAFMSHRTGCRGPLLAKAVWVLGGIVGSVVIYVMADMIKTALTCK